LAHPFKSVPKAVYVVVLVGLKVGESEDGLLMPELGDQITEFTPLTFICVLPPIQIAVSPVNSIEGRGFTKTVISSLEIQPFALVTKTEYTVEEVGFTKIVADVKPLFHK